LNYCGIEVGPGVHHVCALREVRTDEPPVRLEARFFEPGPTEAVAACVRGLGDVVVAIASPSGQPKDGRSRRVCDQRLEECGVARRPYLEPGRELFRALADRGVFNPGKGSEEGNIHEGEYRTAAVFETNAEGVLSALQNRRLPARRHPLGVQRRIEELESDHVLDEGGGLWNRRIEEIDAAAAALCAHRYAVGHARWVGDPEEGVVVLPGTGPLRPFTTEGVLPPVTRVPL
jgi:hypothetical protein